MSMVLRPPGDSGEKLRLAKHIRLITEERGGGGSMEDAGREREAAYLVSVNRGGLRNRRFPSACLPRQHYLPPHPHPASSIQVTFPAFGRIRLCNFLLYTKSLNLLLINL